MDIMFILALLATGLFAGLMMTLVVVMQAHWNTLEKEEYVPYFKGFLRVAKGNPMITILTLASFILPGIIGTVHLTSGNTYQGLITSAAGVVFFLGCFGVTMRLNFPIYTRVMGWRGADSAPDWEDVRRRFYVLNIIRMVSAVAAFMLLGVGVLI